MVNSLDSIFLDEDFDELTHQPQKQKSEEVDPEVTKFMEIIDFVKENEREPQKTNDWSTERALWARLQGFRAKEDRAEKVKKYDTLDLLSKEETDTEFFYSLKEEKKIESVEDIFKTDDLLDDMNGLLDVSRYRKTINAADKIGKRSRSKDFGKYKKLFDDVNADIAAGRRKLIPFKEYDIREKMFYVQNGVMLYVIKIGDFYTDKKGKRNAKMHVVYDNGTENKSLLFRSLASSLYATERHGRIVTELIDDETVAENIGEEFTTGYIYVLKSLSTNPEISKIENLYKIGFTRNDVNKRIMNAENEVTYLNAPVQRVLSVEVKNVNAQKLERTLHHSFEDRQVIFQDSAYKKANEWYVVSIEEIENRMNEIIAGLQK
ncbi:MULTISPECIES: GIY-YIG nuclease family protein [Enterococcus]|uniref:Bacteriophage T5 Orf172 DNA-binding domain-containing protein n=1 Tax=Enterococcus thailandicus TaxID=417368 RepID=A0A179ESH2_ENTTH|nr:MULTISPECIES: GIY-YIG nuclease family protein [Enterococcus]MBD9901176.1 GIY-YIG nuclease family protein [Enterococcus faecium]OAQ55829.1 hypothetical protein A6E74_07125 [Enterococcus thailandicus]RBS51710.1 hypothetical protein EB25_00079 [Enterococcus faecium]TNX06369.1 GIY-YIG nuclease family protein [Enterococcus faecium]